MRPLLSLFVSAFVVFLTSGIACARQPTIPFVACEDATEKPEFSGTLCARVEVPLDHRKPAGAKITLFVRKIPTGLPSKGQLWLVAGGPGESGASFYPFLESLRAAAPNFDLIILDHRGTGYSTRLCPAEEGRESEGGTALAGAEWVNCFDALNADSIRTRAFSITNAAFDLRTLIDGQAKGRKTFVYGVSYGTQLVLRALMVAPPRHLVGVILDSHTPPELSHEWDLSHRSAVVDVVGRRVLAACDRTTKCNASLGGSAAKAMQEVIANPNFKDQFGGNPKYIFGALLDSPDLRAGIPEILEDLRGGDLASLRSAKARLEQMGAFLTAYPQSPLSFPLVSLISASENNARPNLTEATLSAEEHNYLFSSPLPALLLRSDLLPENWSSFRKAGHPYPG
ncbi:MAG: alpha/beta fold hydrolase [Bdellovibrionia bacterium]